MDPSTRRVVARTVAPAFTLHQIGKVSLEQAEADERFGRLHLITALLMCPFAMEAVLNQLGLHGYQMDAELESLWPEFERLDPKQKLKAVASFFSLEFDPGRAPFQVMDELFDFRSDLVHAKTKRLWASEVAAEHFDDGGYLTTIPDSLRSTWELQCNLATAHRWREAVSHMSACLAKAADCSDPLKVGEVVDYWNTLPRQA